MSYFSTQSLKAFILPKRAMLSRVNWHSFSRPGVFLQFTDILLPVSLILATFFFVSGLYQGLVSSPPDSHQGDLVRIMYVHVPASWMALLLYAFIALMSGIFLVWRSPLAEILAVSTAPLGTLFTFLSLATGSLWGKPTWGTFWVWDARLTSVLILFFIYAGYGFLYKTGGGRIAALFALFGSFNLLIIKGSVAWWNTLHQPASVSKFSEPSLHFSFLTPLLLMAGAYCFYSLGIILLTAQTKLRQRKRLRLSHCSPSNI